MNNQNLLITGLMVLICFSCKKDKDEVPPEIRITAPCSQQQINATDTLQIAGTVNDDKNIENITIQITDEQLIPVEESLNIPVNQKSYSINTWFYLENIHLETGTYYLEITAFDGTNTTREFVELNLLEISRTRTAVLIATNPSYHVTYIKKADTSGAGFRHVFTFNNDIRGIAVSSYYQQFYFLSKSGRLQAFSFADSAIVWEKTGLNNPLYEYQGQIRIIDQLVIAGYHSGRFFGFDNYGNTRFSAIITPEQYSPRSFARHHDYLIADLHTTNPYDKFIELFYYNTGASAKMKYITFDVVHFYSYDGDKDRILIWGNDNGQAKVCTLSVYYNLIYDMERTPPGGKLHDVVKTGTHEYITAIGSQIYKYDSYYDMYDDFHTGISASVLEYDEYSGEIFAADGKTVYALSESGDVYYQLAAQDTVRAVGLLYNR